MRRRLRTCTVLLNYFNSELCMCEKRRNRRQCSGQRKPWVAAGPRQRSQTACPDPRLPGVAHSPWGLGSQSGRPGGQPERERGTPSGCVALTVHSRGTSQTGRPGARLCRTRPPEGGVFARLPFSWPGVTQAHLQTSHWIQQGPKALLFPPLPLSVVPSQTLLECLL